MCIISIGKVKKRPTATPCGQFMQLLKHLFLLHIECPICHRSKSYERMYPHLQNCAQKVKNRHCPVCKYTVGQSQKLKKFTKSTLLKHLKAKHHKYKV